MKWTLTGIRLLQLKRQISDLGIFYVLVGFLLLCFAIFFSYKQYRQAGSAIFISTLIIILLFIIHTIRPDKSFVLKQIDNPVKNIFTEYAVFTSPLTLPGLFTHQWFHLLIMLLLFYIISAINISLRQRTILANLSNIIPADNFEWLSSSRKHYLYLSLCLIAALITSWLKIVPLFFLWIFTFTITSFYTECEPLHILFASSENMKKLLRSKIIRHSILLIMIFAPVLIINSFFHPEMTFINIAFILVEIILLAFSILLKYTSYRPDENLNGNSILISLVTIGVIIPFLLPVPLIMCFRNYRKAIKNLNRYFND